MSASAAAMSGTDLRGAAAVEPLQYLTFMLDGEQFAIGILGIREILGYGTLTVVPMMPACIRGVINLRGAVVPVMDLSARFGRKAAAVTKRTCIVIVEIAGEGGRQDVGLIVDAVNAVVDIAPADIEPPPHFGARLRAELIQGMGKVDGRFVIVLNAERIWSTELAALDLAGEGAGGAPQLQSSLEST